MFVIAFAHVEILPEYPPVATGSESIDH